MNTRGSLAAFLSRVLQGNLFHDVGLFVDSVIVDDQVKGEFPWGFPAELLQKSQPFLVLVLGGHPLKDFPVQITQCCKKRDAATPEIITNSRSHFSWP